MLTMKRTSCVAAAVVVALAAVGVARPPAAAPVGEQDLIKLIELELGDPAIVGKGQKEGVAFKVNEESVARLKKAGASEAVLEAVRKAAETKKPAAPGKAITYEDVLKLLELGIDEKEILKRLEKSPTVFTLGADQVEELKKAGASETLLAALAGKS